jgi:hypothetical protein
MGISSRQNQKGNTSNTVGKWTQQMCKVQFTQKQQNTHSAKYTPNFLQDKPKEVNKLILKSYQIPFLTTMVRI